MIQGLINITLIVSATLIVLLQSCNRTPLTEIPVTQNVTFETRIKPITSTLCIECHSQGEKNFSRYENAYSYRMSIYQRVAVDKSMPFGKYLSDQDRALFRDWVNQGANK